MPPALKVLSLITTVLCVLLLFWGFSFKGTTEHKDSNQVSIFKPSYKRTHKTPAGNGGQVGAITPFSTSTRINKIVPLFREGTYFDYGVSATATLDVNTLTRIGSNYYKNTEAIYYASQLSNDCNESAESRLTQLSVQNPTIISEVHKGNFITDGLDVFVLFYKVRNADPASFSYLGIASHEGDGIYEINAYWYKDKNKLYTLTTSYDGCSGFILNESPVDTLKDVDISTFEYIGYEQSDINTYYAKDKNYFYTSKGKISDTVTPKNCAGDYFKECLPKIKSEKTATTTIQQE